MAIFEKPDLKKLKDEHKYARLIDWANYTKDPATSRQAREILASDPYGLTEYLYETAEWTRKNSGHSGRRLPHRGIALLKQVTTMMASVGAPIVTPVCDSIRAYDKYGDPDIKTKLLYYSLAFDVLEHIGGNAREGLEKLAREKDADIKKLARAALENLPEDLDEWDDDDDEDDDEEYEDDDEGEDV